MYGPPTLSVVKEEMEEICVLVTRPVDMLRPHVWRFDDPYLVEVVV